MKLLVHKKKKIGQKIRENVELDKKKCFCNIYEWSLRNENVSTCLYGNPSATNVKSSPVRHFSNPNDQDAFETALEENIDALDDIGGEGGEESLFPDDSIPGKCLFCKV